MGKWLKKFEEINHYEAFRESDDYLLPNVSWITSSDEVMYNPDVKEIGPKVTLRYRSTADNLLAFCNGGNNVKSLKVDGKNIEFEPLVIGLNEVEILNSEVKINYEAESEYEMFDFPDSYVITSLPSSIVVKPKDSNVKIGDIGNMMLFVTMSGMKMCQPLSFEDMNGMFVIDEENNQLVCTEQFLAEFEMIISYGYGYGFGFCTVNEETGEFTAVDSLMIYEGTTGGLKTPYYFDKEGEHIVEMELMSGDFGGLYMFYDMATEISAPLTSVIFNEKITSIEQYTFFQNTLLTKIICESIIAPTLNQSVVYIAPYGTLIYPEGSDYSSWLSTEEGCLGYYGWNSEPTFMTGTINVTDVNNEYRLYNNGDVFIGAQINGEWVNSIYHAFDNVGEYVVKYALRDETKIGNNAFDNCSDLTSVVIPNSVTSIGNYAFSFCTGLTGELIIPDSVTKIGEYAFNNCSDLTSVVIPDSVTTIGDYAFRSCSGLTSVVIPDSVTSIGEGAFGNCIGLTGELIIPDSVTTIGIRAFQYCKDLTSVEIGSGVTSIGSQAFYYCTGLASVEIGSGVTSIGSQAFYGCTGLTSIVCHAPTVPTIDYDTFYGIKREGTLIYPEGSDYSSWLSTDSYYLGCYEWNKVLSEITAVYNATGTTSATKLLGTKTDIAEMVVDGVKLDKVVTGYTFDTTGEHTVIYKMYDIPASAFYFCTGLTSVVIGSGVTSIGIYAFYGCSGLTGELIIPDSVTKIGEYAFNRCSGLTGELIIPDSVTTIGDYAFYFCKGLTGELVIPDSVTSIGSGAFMECNGLESIVVEGGNPVYDSRENCNCIIETSTNTLIQGYKNSFIPNSVTYIGDYAFSFCTGLTGELIIPDSVTKIGEYAFNNCYGLTSVVIPDSVTTIGDYVFTNCTCLISVEIGSGCTSIGAGAFRYCRGLEEITCYAVIAPTIDSSTFDGIKKGGTLIYPEGSDYSSWLSTDSYYLGYYEWNKVLSEITAVYNATGTTSATKLLKKTTDIVEMVVDGVKLDSVVTGYTFDTTGEHTVVYKMYDIPASAFSGCTSLTSLTIGSGVTTIGNQAFNDCSSLTGELVIPDSVTEIRYDAFRNCSSLTSLTIGSGVTTIGDQAFDYCSSLTGELVIPASVTSIGDQAFGDCRGLESIVVNSNNTVYDSRENCNCIIETSTNALIRGCNNSFIPDSVTSIGGAAFYYCTGLTGDLVIPDSVTSIGYSAFYNCWCLTGDLVIPDSVTSIGSAAFYYCSGLTGELVISDSVTEISHDAFHNCSSLTSVTIGSGVTSIGSQAFKYCYGLTGELVIPDSVTSIGANAFIYCSGLTGDLVIPDSVTSIGFSAFQGCTGLTSVEIGSGVTTIDSQAFSSCYGLTSVVIPNSVTEIGSTAFYNCRGLTSVVIPNSVTSIGNYAFNGCTGLTGELVIPESVTTIGENAFMYCFGLTSVEIGSGVTSIGNRAFNNCIGLREIVCHAPTAPTIQSSTFQYITTGGVLKVPTGSDYSTWMSEDEGYFGYNNWIIEYI